MRLVCTSALICLAFTLSACTTHPGSASQQVATAPGSQTTAKHVVRATLKNGLRVVIVRDAFAPVATQQITYLAGSNQSPESFPGMAHAQEHMMFRGSPGLDKDQLGQIIARLGGNMNAFTADEFTSYYFTVPADDIDVALHVGALRMAGVDDSEAQWEKERGAIEQEVASDNSNPSTALYEKMLAHVFAGTPYAYFGVGTRASFDKTTAEMLKKFHAKWYAPNNALLVVTGDVAPQALLAKIKKLYGAIPSRTIPKKSAVSFAPVVATTLRTQTDQPSGYVELAFRLPGYRSPDYPAAVIAADVLASDRGPISALYYQGKVLSAGFSKSAWKDAGLGYAWAGFSPGAQPESVRRTLMGAIDKVLKDGIDPELVKAAKRRILLDQQLKHNSIHGLANAWTWALAKAGLSSPAEWTARLQAVTPKQVSVEVKKILDTDHAVTLVAEPTPGAKPVRKKSRGGAESFGGQPNGSVTLPDWAKKAFAKLPHPTPFLHPSDMHLPNGIRLIVQPLKVSHSITLLGAVHQKRILQTPKGEMGVSGLLHSLFDWGPKGMTRLEFESTQDEIGAYLSVGSGFSLYVLPEHFDAGLKLLSNALLHPRLPAKALKSRRRITAKQAAGRVDSPLFKYGQAVRRALYPQGDPVLRYATKKSVSGLTLKQVKTYYKKVYRPDETTIVVLGEITPQEAKAEVEKYFGDWKAHGSKPDLSPPPVPESKSTRVFVPDESRVQNVAELAETMDLSFTDPAHFAFHLVNDYLTGGFYGSPLTHKMREELGLVYSVRTGASFSRHRGSFYLAYGADPSKTEQARSVGLKALQHVIDTPLSAKQLHLAKSIALRKIELGQQSVHGIANTWLGRSTSDLPLDWSYVQARYYEKVTPAEIQAALKQYLDPSRLSTFILGPPEQ
jgi:zinc protease